MNGTFTYMNGWFVWFTDMNGWLPIRIFIHHASCHPEVLSSVRSKLRLVFPGSEPTPGGCVDVQWRSGMCGQGIPGSNRTEADSARGTGRNGQSNRRRGALNKVAYLEGLRIFVFSFWLSSPKPGDSLRDLFHSL